LKYHVHIGENTHTIEIRGGHAWVGDQKIAVDLAHVTGDRARTGVASMLLDGRSWPLAYRKGAGRSGSWGLSARGRSVQARVLDERTAKIHELSTASAANQGPRPVKAPMPGLISAIEVEVGDRVSAGQGVVIVEAMKMENELKAQADAVVAEILVSAGHTVEKDQVLVTFVVPESGD